MDELEAKQLRRRRDGGVTLMETPLEMYRRKRSKSRRGKILEVRPIHYLHAFISLCGITLSMGLAPVLVGCAAAPLQQTPLQPPLQHPLQQQDIEPVARGEDLHIHLIFGEEADLDLYVTGPGSETIYFGNNPSRAGGVLESDQRCDVPAPRIERIRVPAAASGRYRVGVEFAAKCRTLRGPVPYRIEVRGNDLQIDQPGKISLGHFENVALEFDLPSESSSD